MHFGCAEGADVDCEVTAIVVTQEEVPVASVEEGDPEVTATDEEVAAVVRVEGDCS